MTESENPFKYIDPNRQVPKRLKKALVSEIDTIRNASNIIQLFVGDFINALIAHLPSGEANYEPKKDLD